jgi:hypothetical protein
MVVVEYLGGLPRRQDAARVEVTVDRRALRFKQGGFLRGWSHQLPFDRIASVELTTAREVEARGLLPPSIQDLPGQARAYFLALEAPPGDHAPSVILRGPWADLDRLRQDILQARMRAAKQWQS